MVSSTLLDIGLSSPTRQSTVFGEAGGGEWIGSEGSKCKPWLDGAVLRVDGAWGRAAVPLSGVEVKDTDDAGSKTDCRRGVDPDVGGASIPEADAARNLEGKLLRLFCLWSSRSSSFSAIARKRLDIVGCSLGLRLCPLAPTDALNSEPREGVEAVEETLPVGESNDADPNDCLYECRLSRSV